MQRWIALLVSLPLLALLILLPGFAKLPYVRYQPGVTVDVLGQDGRKPIIEVTGHDTYPTGGQMRMTTVFVTPPAGGIDLYTAIDAWLDPDDAVYPYDLVYPDNQSEQDADQQSAVAMVSSQDTAVAAALVEMGQKVMPVVEVQSVTPGMPAEGRLEVRDRLVAVDGTLIRTAEDVVKVVRAAKPGQPLDFEIVREGRKRKLTITPVEQDGRPMVGIVPGTGFDLPFRVRINVDESIGGPSAGLMFSLGIYDTLTPGRLAGDHEIAGTGTIDAGGKVGPIGGIQQKVVAARREKADLFLVPAENCADALDAPRGDVRLVRADTLGDAVAALKKYDADSDATLPTCESWVRQHKEALQ